ncbi:hypothetical protein [Granulicella tundricola]|uniref:Uncharacterized protein n=1 Tax=Granulicella tundricola (strain ATCC BAA-1859 / DSM 23138 / MP5ACTX9) TaxID=1198114 RepID=E8X786_GRATM|nr:hypothetical protein [Granulicella tundricola]ADW71320.1 hypothetical protein AciX9_4368 [Granulicella tundricola MP5ACTX9]
MKAAYPTTPDGRYFVVKGRLWRCTNPSLPAATKAVLVKELMQARRFKGEAMRKGDTAGRQQARQRVDLVKHQLGERGPVWWNDGAPDLNRHIVINTPYADWFIGLSA